MKGNYELNRVALLKLEELINEINTLESRINRADQDKTEDFILDGWAIELELANMNKDTLEKWIIDQEFPI